MSWKASLPIAALKRSCCFWYVFNEVLYICNKDATIFKDFSGDSWLFCEEKKKTFIEVLVKNSLMSNFHGTSFNRGRERGEERPQGGRCAALRAGTGVGPGRPSSCGTAAFRSGEAGSPSRGTVRTRVGGCTLRRSTAARAWAAASTRTQQANTGWARISGLRAPCADDSRGASRRPCVYLLGRPRTGCGRAGFAGLAGILNVRLLWVLGSHTGGKEAVR